MYMNATYYEHAPINRAAVGCGLAGILQLWLDLRGVSGGRHGGGRRGRLLLRERDLGNLTVGGLVGISAWHVRARSLRLSFDHALTKWSIVVSNQTS